MPPKQLVSFSFWSDLSSTQNPSRSIFARHHANIYTLLEREPTRQEGGGLKGQEGEEEEGEGGGRCGGWTVDQEYVRSSFSIVSNTRWDNEIYL